MWDRSGKVHEGLFSLYQVRAKVATLSKNNRLIAELGELLDLKAKLAYVGFNKLGLRGLDPLRAEVETRIEKILAEGKKPLGAP